eukprot:7380169-Prymnesium_polylepis.1
MAHLTPSRYMPTRPFLPYIAPSPGRVQRLAKSDSNATRSTPCNVLSVGAAGVGSGEAAPVTVADRASAVV